MKILVLTIPKMSGYVTNLKLKIEIKLKPMI